MPFVTIRRIIIDPARQAVTRSPVGAADEHDVASGSGGVAKSGWDNARQNINVIVRRTARTIGREINLAYQAFGIDHLPAGRIAAEIDQGDPVESRSYGSVARVAR